MSHRDVKPSNTFLAELRALIREEIRAELAEQAAQSEWLSAYDAAQILGVHPKTLRKWIREKRLEATRAGDRHYRIRRADLDRLLKNGSTNDNLTPEQMAARKYG